MPVVPIDQLALALYITVVSGVMTGLLLRATSGLRTEMKEEFARVRAEIKAGDSSVRGDLKDEIQSLEGRMESGFARMDQQMESGFSRVDHQLDGIRAEMAIMRSDLTRVALEVGVEPREASGT